MAKHLTDTDISNVCELLDDWPIDSKLTWDRLVEAVAHDYKISTTRQTLQKQARIKRAFTEVKELVSGNTPPKAVAARNRHLPSSLKAAADQLEKRERTIARLESENSRLLEQFHTWLYNATQHGITIEQLNEPLETKQKK
ncbi:transposase [Vibrio sp. JCM 18904]|nr:transposase [Vibrio sp. JCM 18904]